MTNPFYQNTFDVVPGATVGSQTLENQFLLVKQGFDLVAPINSPAFTGTPTVPTPTTAGMPTTKAYVDALAFNTAIPAATAPGKELISDATSTTTWGMSPASIYFAFQNFGVL